VKANSKKCERGGWLSLAAAGEFGMQDALEDKSHGGTDADHLANTRTRGRAAYDVREPLKGRHRLCLQSYLNPEGPDVREDVRRHVRMKTSKGNPMCGTGME